MKTRKYNINGQVVHNKTQKGLGGLRVEAYDKDYITEGDYLGKANTDEEGRFIIRFTSEQSREWIIDKKPDLHFRVYDGHTLVEDTINSVSWNVLAAEQEIVIPLSLTVGPGEEGGEFPQPEPVNEFRVYCRLINKETKESITNGIVNVYSLEEGEEQLPLDYALSDEQGLFSLAFVNPESDETLENINLKLIVRAPNGDPTHEEDFEFMTNSTEVVDIEVSLATEGEGEGETSATLDELCELFGLSIPSELSLFFEENEIETLADLRGFGCLKRNKGLPISHDEPVVSILDSLNNLSTVSTDSTVAVEILKKGYNSVHAIAEIPNSKFVTDLGDKLGETNAAQIQMIARAHTKLSSQLMASIVTNNANGLGSGVDLDEWDISEFVQNECSCEERESCVSPLAYLADLLEYAVSNLSVGGNVISLDTLSEYFHQPFAKLPASIEQMDAKVPQVRICIEVLRSYLGANPPNREREQALKQAEANYCFTAYRSILDKLGVSFEEIRFARTSSNDSRAVLAERIGVNPNHLNDLFLEPDSNAMSESKLESLFGFRDTTSDPLKADEVSDLHTWRLEHLRNKWFLKDWPGEQNTFNPPPLVDPDLINAADLNSPTAGDPVFDLWQTRLDWIRNRLGNLETTRRAAASEEAGFKVIVEGSLGITIDQFDKIVEDRQAGKNVGDYLKEILIDRDAFSYLERARYLVRSNSLLNSEWKNIYSILLQVEKRQKYSVWRDEEKAKALSLSPVYFRISDPIPVQFPSLDSEPLPEWRATISGRNAWQDTLKSRIDQERTLINAHSDALSQAEAVVLPVLRDALISAFQTPYFEDDITDFKGKAEWLTDNLLIDCQVDGSQMTTRISQAINTLQVLLFSVRTRQFHGSSRFEFKTDAFDEEWEWLGSYATWRSAMFAYLYPENILIPSLRRWQTPGFRKLLSDTRGNRRLNPEQLAKYLKEYSDYFFDVCQLTIEASCQALTLLKEGTPSNPHGAEWGELFYMFGRGKYTNTMYWSVHDPKNVSEYAQSFWDRIPGMDDIVDISGAASYVTKPREPFGSRKRYILIFGRHMRNDVWRLVFTKYDLELRKWDSAPQELELPAETGSEFYAVVQQNILENSPYKFARPPRVAIHKNQRTYVRRLNRTLSDWDDFAWKEWSPIPELSWDKLPNMIRQLCGMVQVSVDLYYIILRVDEHVWGSHSFFCFLMKDRQSNNGYPPEILKTTKIKNVSPYDRSFGGAFVPPNSSNIYVIGEPKGNTYTYKIWYVSGQAEIDGYRDGELSGIEQLAPASGEVRHTSRQFAYKRDDLYGNHFHKFRTVFDMSANKLDVTKAIAISPHNIERSSRYEINADVGGKDWIIKGIFEDNQDQLAANLEYIKEAYYFVPMFAALQLQRRFHYAEALDWFRSVYDYSASPQRRKIYYGLVKEESLDNVFERSDDWLLDPLNPHAVASTRANTYTRFTVLSIVRCFLNYADVEFTRDTVESVSRASTLYTSAMKLLDSEDLKLDLRDCGRLVNSIEIETTDPKWAGVLVAIKADLATIKNIEKLKQTKERVLEIWKQNNSIEEKFTQIRKAIAKAKEDQSQTKQFETVITEKLNYLAESNHAIQCSPLYVRSTSRLNLKVVRENDDVSVMGTSPVGMAEYADFSSVSVANTAVKWLRQYVPNLSYSFCIPTNPIIESLQLKAELNLYKIRGSRNITGVKRDLDPYSAPTDATSGLPVIGAGGQLSLPGSVSFKPTQYRYSVIIDRAKQLVSLAQQVEAAFLSAIEKRDAEYYNLIKAQQDIRTTRAGIRLQDLHIRVVEGEVKLSELQKNRAQLQADHYKKLLDEGESQLELESLKMLQVAQGLYVQASIMSAIPNIIAGMANGLIIDFSGIYTGLAQNASTESTILSTFASYERRAQEWSLQNSIALHDVKTGAQQVKNSENQLRVAAQERKIASLQAEHAEQTAEFLAAKFTNVELYDWMSDILEGVYGFFLQQASAMARLALSQLAFQRQESPPPFIQDDYWKLGENTFSAGATEGKPVDRRGLTGSALLLQDIFQLDQFAFETEKRKNQLTKNISLVGFSPAEFYRFKETGVMNFATPMELFDRDFPGDYLRLIKRIKVSIIALVPAIDSIKATLTTVGSSRIVVGGDVFQIVNGNGKTETVALSSPRDATGLFELQPQASDKLNPFEGIGVDNLWQFKLPKAANLFDFNSIADIIFTIEYTSLSSFTYRQQVIQQLKREIGGERPFSFRNQFADQWYDLSNPGQSDTPMTVNFNIRETDFPQNIQGLKIEHVALYFVRADGLEIEIPVTYLRFTDSNGGIVGGGAKSNDGVISTRRGNASSWTSMIGEEPSGSWELSLNDNLDDGRAVVELFSSEEITDILFVITYSGNTPKWPE